MRKIYKCKIAVKYSYNTDICNNNVLVADLLYRGVPHKTFDSANYFSYATSILKISVHFNENYALCQYYKFYIL